jgi:hypothetical protein
VFCTNSGKAEIVVQKDKSSGRVPPFQRSPDYTPTVPRFSPSLRWAPILTHWHHCAEFALRPNSTFRLFSAPYPMV